MRLALFDFDGTITTKDSLVDFIQYVVGRPAYYLGLLRSSPILSAYALKLIPNHIAKEKLIAYFFKEWDAERFKRETDRYALKEIDKIIRPQAMEKIRWHQGKGHQVVIVSASVECWLKAWCDKNDIDLIATRLEIKENRLTGRFATKNCYGIEKANRVQESYDLSAYEYIYAYGDSRGDRELLALSDESHYKPFREE